MLPSLLRLLGERPASLPDQRGRVAVVTGANRGLGRAAAHALARAGARVVLTTRDQARGAAALEEVRAAVPGASAELVRLDLADLASVDDTAAALAASLDRLDVLLANAGVMGLPVRHASPRGVELQMATNHLGHFALAARLWPLLAGTPGARVVVVTSLQARRGRLDPADPGREGTYTPYGAYARSKLANLVLAVELDRRVRAAGLDVTAVAAHPGYTDTDLHRLGPRSGADGPMARGPAVAGRLVGQDAALGADPLLHAATAPGVPGGALVVPRGPGQLWGRARVAEPFSNARDPQLGAALWTWSEEATGVRWLVG